MSIFSELAKAESENRLFALVTIVSTEGSVAREAGTQMIYYEDGTIYGTVGGGIVEHNAKLDAAESLKTGCSVIRNYDIPAGGPKSDMLSGSVKCFIQPRTVAKKLFLFGAGHVSQEVIPLAKQMGFYVTVIDPREPLSKTENALKADRFILDDYEIIDTMSFDDDCYILICTYDHAIDGVILGKALQTGAKYIGMLGGKPKIQKLFSRLKEEGLSDDMLSCAFTPAGLDIGGQEPKEIALSIVAELLAVKNGRNGGFCRFNG